MTTCTDSPGVIEGATQTYDIDVYDHVTWGRKSPYGTWDFVPPEVLTTCKGDNLAQAIGLDETASRLLHVLSPPRSLPRFLAILQPQHFRIFPIDALQEV
jgi:hypothetical protein